MVDLVNMLGSLLFPPHCVGCKEPGGWICGKCRNSHLIRSPPECFWCRKISNSYITHSSCRRHTPIRQMTVCWRYGRLARIVMGTYKFKMKYGIAREIIELADAQIQPLIQSSTLFVPAPTTRKRTLERGFNQSTLLCQIMSKKYKIPYEELLLKKSGGSHQTGKDRAQRLELGMGDFDIHEEYKKFPSDTHIVIVDDVCTTGTTLQRCAETLSEYGFTDINALVLFRGKPNYSRDRDQSSKSARCT